MRVLVTGGAGFIGSHVVAPLRRAGHEVSAPDNLHPAAHGPAAGGPASGLTDAVGGPRPRITGRFRAGDVRHIMADPAKARTLGFKAATPFERGLREFAHAPLRERPGGDA